MIRSRRDSDSPIACESCSRACEVLDQDQATDAGWVQDRSGWLCPMHSMAGLPREYAMDYDRAKNFARVLLNESRARRDSPANRNYQWSLINGAERATRMALGLNALVRRHRHPEWAEHLGIGDGSPVVHRSTGLRGVVHGTMGVYLTLQPGPHAKFWRATEFDLATPATAAPAQLELFA